MRTKFAFETLNLHRVESEALAENEASQRAVDYFPAASDARDGSDNGRKGGG